MARLVGSKWMADARVNGKRVRPTFRTKLEAEAFEMNSLAEEKKRQDGSNATVGEVFQHGYDFWWARRKNASTRLQHTEEIIQHFGETAPVSTITAAKIQDWNIKLLVERKNSKRTINNKLSALSKLLNHAVTRGAIPKRPEIVFYSNEECASNRTRFLSPEEEQAVFEHLDLNDRAMAQFLLYTGCRYSEAANLRWQDVEPDLVLFWDTKNGKPRSVPLPSRAKAALQYTKGQGWKQPFSEIDYDRFYRHFIRACQKAGLDEKGQIMVHTLRHTCASRMVQRQVPLYVVQKWLGHSSIKVTERYAHLRKEELAEAAKVLEV